MSYKVIHAFTDSQDFGHIYRVGEVYPRPGLKITESRLRELASNKNKRKIPLIAPDKDIFSSYMNPPKEPDLPFVTVPNNSGKKYTKTEINRLSTSELRDLAKENGLDNADKTTGAELKKILIEKFGL